MSVRTRPAAVRALAGAGSPAAPGTAVTRRQVLRGAGAGVAMLAGSTLLGGDRKPVHVATTERYVSRPDLISPRIEVTGASGAGGHVFLSALIGPGQHGPTIIGQDGQLAWFRPVTGASAANFGVQAYRGRPVLTWWEGVQAGGHGMGEYVLADASYREIGRVKAGNGLSGDLHEFVITPAGTALFSVFQSRSADLTAAGAAGRGTLLDCLVQEVDIATGQVLFQWRASDHVSLRESHAVYQPGTPYDFFHLNSVDVSPDGASLLISARHTWTVYSISRATGQIQWRLGGKKSDFALGPGTRFYWQHHARWHGGATITIFDDGAGLTRNEPLSRGITLAVDTTRHTARLARSHTHPGYLADAMGSMQALPGGGAFVGWGTVPAFTSFRPDGSIGLDGYVTGGDISYRTFLSAWTGRPAEPPRVATAARGGGQRRAYASWNGATGVAAWRLRAGRSPAGLRADHTAAATGFETALPVPAAARYLAVDAFSAGGEQLGSSAVIPAR